MAALVPPAIKKPTWRQHRSKSAQSDRQKSRLRSASAGTARRVRLIPCCGISPQVIKEAKRIKDWPALEAAVDAKIAEQVQFIAWWDDKVQRPGGNRPRRML
jgi:hypothetical protein